jgi:hypothetical protein
LRDSLLRLVYFFVTAIIFFVFGIHFFCACSKHGEYIQFFGAFLVEPRLRFVLQWSVFVKLDNCLHLFNTDSLGCLFLQESSGFLCFLFLWHFFHRNHDSCSAVTFSERHQESCLYGADVESYIGYQFVRQKQSTIQFYGMVYILRTMASVHHFCPPTTIAAPPPHVCAAIAVPPPPPLPPPSLCCQRHCRCCAA